jgi:accessory gene regulator B
MIERQRQSPASISGGFQFSKQSVAGAIPHRRLRIDGSEGAVNPSVQQFECAPRSNLGGAKFEEMATGVTHFFARFKVIVEEDEAVYVYGFQLLISTVFNIALVLLVAFCMGVFAESLFFITSFVASRCILGGYHAKSHIRCVLAFSLVFAIFSWLSVRLFCRFANVYMIVGTILSFLLIWELAPVEPPNRNMSEAKRARLKYACLLLSSTFAAIAILYNMVPLFRSDNVVFLYSGYIAAMLSMAFAAAVWPREGYGNSQNRT